MNIDFPPEFGPDGSPPPLRSEPVLIARQDLNKTLLQWRATAHPFEVSYRQAMIPFYYFAKLAQYLTKEPTAVKNMLKENNLPHFEPREVWQWPTFALYECFWQREDPVMQLPPGASSELVLSFRVGVSLERSREISAALGLKRGREKQKEQQTEISFHAAGKVTRKLCLSEEREVTHKQLLKNTASDQYRRLAVWHLMHRITIIAAPDAELAVKAVCQETEFILSDASNVTFADVPLPPIPPTSAPSSQP